MTCPATKSLCIDAYCVQTQACHRTQNPWTANPDADEGPRIERAEYERDFPDDADAPRGWEP